MTMAHPIRPWQASHTSREASFTSVAFSSVTCADTKVTAVL